MGLVSRLPSPLHLGPATEFTTVYRSTTELTRLKRFGIPEETFPCRPVLWRLRACWPLPDYCAGVLTSYAFPSPHAQRLPSSFTCGLAQVRRLGSGAP